MSNETSTLAAALLREALRLARVKRERRRGDGTLYRQSGSRFWWMQYWRGGKRHRESTKTESRREAEKTLKAKLRSSLQ